MVDVGVALVSHRLSEDAHQAIKGWLPDPTRADPFPPLILRVIALVSTVFRACVIAVGRGWITVRISISINVVITVLSVIRR